MNTEINTYLQTIALNYDVRYTNISNNNSPTQDQVDQSLKMNKEFAESLSFEVGKVYIKVITNTSVHSFIVKEDTKQFKKGDILKAASWRAPAKNFTRGNIFNTESFKNVCWAGA